jgi:predicted PurR-regulated permease PerM
MVGIIVAPVVLAILIGFVEIYRERFFDSEPEPQGAAGPRPEESTP